jgi:hypothetical protein
MIFGTEIDYELPAIYALYIDLSQKLQCISTGEDLRLCITDKFNDISVDTQIIILDKNSRL